MFKQHQVTTPYIEFLGDTSCTICLQSMRYAVTSNEGGDSIPPLTKEKIEALNTLIEKKACNSAISRILGTSEGTVRYHRKKRSLTSLGNGNTKESKAIMYEELISDWMGKAAADKRPANIRELHEHLVSITGTATLISRYCGEVS
ncbi:hypothetical protein OOT00_02140 [Desulfobotulus sp. H1]|uniref:HTH luxR-type domain-containing protein n=1 Tax=Desulfobotulus pelophilus TaxID=2823377 RepID=A0ABT3N5P8_9BACT|nr:hypothetical protein [Desulfobotulus pelophilus]MCW7752783.1 hypothetical protein [Desulfobotulus pelophilus]